MAGTGGKDLVARSVPDTGHTAVPASAILQLVDPFGGLRHHCYLCYDYYHSARELETKQDPFERGREGVIS